MTEPLFVGTEICHGSPFTFDPGNNGKQQGLFRATDSNGTGCDSADVSDTGHPDVLFLPVVVPTIVFRFESSGE